MDFQFGDVLENGWASDLNPQKRGFFVKQGVRTGRLNPGPYVEITDGHGKFWQFSAGPNNKIARVAPSKIECKDLSGATS